jgi:hypothetical protein
MGKLSDVGYDSLRDLIGNMALSNGGLAEGTNAATYKTANTISYLSDGQFKSKGATDNVAFSSGHYTLKDGYSCLFVVALDGDGNFKTFQGEPFKAETVGGATKYRGYRRDAQGNYEMTSALVDKTSSYLPDVDAGYSPVGIIKVATSGAAFVPGTTDLGAGTVTDTYYNVGVLPADTNL